MVTYDAFATTRAKASLPCLCRVFQILIFYTYKKLDTSWRVGAWINLKEMILILTNFGISPKMLYVLLSLFQKTITNVVKSSLLEIFRYWVCHILVHVILKT